MTLDRPDVIADLASGFVCAFYDRYANDLEDAAPVRAVPPPSARSEAFADGFGYRPETAFGTMNTDILERTQPGYRRPNFCDLIAANPLGGVMAQALHHPGGKASPDFAADRSLGLLMRWDGPRFESSG